MSKKFKSQASSARAASAAFGGGAFGFVSPTTFQTASSPLAYVAELPDLSGISEPEIVVAFKNLSKKDSTTKVKALEELQEHLASQRTAEAGVETGLLEAWTTLYPRTSIDNSRRVRQLAHSLQGNLTVLSGKRIAAHLPKLIGSWLSGRFDNDKGVSRAVQDGLEKAFPSLDKRKAVWKIYKGSLLDYAEDAILLQTAKTLSDERTTSPDDAESKQVRVAGNAMHMFLELLQAQDDTDAAKPDPKIAAVLKDPKIWAFSYHADPHLRRSVYNLLHFCIFRYPSDLDWTVLSTCLLAKSLHISQLGSSRQFSEVLLSMTSTHPQVWTSDYTAKTTAGRRLIQFLKQGSQRGPEEFWTNVAQILRKIPVEVWRSKDSKAGEVTAADCTGLLQALHDGIASTEEPRANASVAWTTYIDFSFWAVNHIADAGDRDNLFKDHVSPLVSRYVAQSSDQLQWAMPPNVSARICSYYLVHLIEHRQTDLFEKLWSEQVDLLIDGVKLSLPETSKDFKSSQNSVIATSTRFFVLQTEVRKALAAKSLADAAVVNTLKSANSRLISSCLEIIKNRNGKPFGAAEIVAATIPLLGQDEKSEALESFLQSDLPRMLGSPSSRSLVSVLFSCRTFSTYSETLSACIRTLLQSPDSEQNTDVLCHVMRGLNAIDLSQNPVLAEFIVKQLELALHGDSSRWPLVYTAVQNTALHSTPPQDRVQQVTSENDFQHRVLGQMLESLSIDSMQEPAIEGLEGLLSVPRGADSPISESFAGTLLSKMLVLSDSADEQVAERAKLMASRLKTMLEKSGASTVAQSTTELIRDQYQGVGQPLSIFGLFELVRDTFQNVGPDHKGPVAHSILPTAEEWRLALAPHLSNSPAPSTAITSSFGGIVYAVKSLPVSSTVAQDRDAEGFSVLFRLAFCATKLIKTTHVLDYIDEAQVQILFEYLPRALLLINEKITLESANSVWLSSTPEVVDEAVDVISDGHSQIYAWNETSSSNDSHPADGMGIDQYWLKQVDKIQGTSSEAYQLGRACTTVILECGDMDGPGPNVRVFEDRLKLIRKSDNLIQSAILIKILRDRLVSSGHGKKLCNELITDVTELKDLNGPVEAIRPLLLLNVLLETGETLMESIPTQRVVYLLKNLVTLLTPHPCHSGPKAEILKLLSHILPSVLEIYGEHWQQLLDLLVEIWSIPIDLDRDLPTLHSSLKLYVHMRTVIPRDVNEDFSDAWKASSSKLGTGLVKALMRFDKPYKGTNQPRDITTQLLCWALPKRAIEDSMQESEKLYPLIASSEASVQCAAYNLLAGFIPGAQAQLSLDIALEKKAVQLPPELLSLILEKPKLQDMRGSDASDQSKWNDLSRYLLAWKLMLDHFPQASYKLKEMYVAGIKDSGRIPDLLDLACEFLRIASGRPLDPSNFDIDGFQLELGKKLEERELQWLMVNLYYECLLYLPGLAKDWFIKQKNRIKSPLESWTQKHISPLIVKANLGTVNDWAATQDADDRPITVKTSPKGSDLTASITIDEESPPISLSISLPGAYPLDQAVITSRNRVGVSEKNWQSWLRTFQIIIFSTGSLIEGLIAFRRNVQGALKGQSECAICYSIIGTDMQTPNKKCGTCKNTFHGVCLFRWFKSSNSSTCPLCRNNFNYA